MAGKADMTAAEFRQRYLGEDGKRKRDRISKLCFPESAYVGARLSGPYTILILPLPPTKNSEPKNKYEVQRLRAQWADFAVQAWQAAGSPRYESVEIRPRFYLLRHNRDYDNLFGQAFKGLQDGLRGCLVEDDNARCITLLGADMIAGEVPKLELWISPSAQPCAATRARGEGEGR